MISWVFFDVGNVIVNDVPAMALVYELMYKEIQKIHPEISFQDILALREELILNNTDGGHHWTIGQKYLSEEAWFGVRARVFETIDRDYDKYNLLIPGIRRVIEQMADSYRIGIAANQVKACRQALERYGLLRYFSLALLSEEVGVSKPDIRFYEMLLRKARSPAEQCVMMGDRVDFDIMPAKSLGMKTIRVKLDLDHQGYEPKTEYERLYFESQRRASLSYADPTCDAETPDITVTRLEDIPSAVNRMA